MAGKLVFQSRQYGTVVINVDIIEANLREQNKPVPPSVTTSVAIEGVDEGVTGSKDKKNTFQKKLLASQSPFKRKIAVLMGGTAFSQLLLFLAAPLLTRLYDPEHFGIYQIYVAVLSVLLTFCALCYERAIPLAEDESTVAHIQLLCFLALFGTAFLTFLVTLALRTKITEWTKSPPEASLYFLFLPVGLLCGGAYQILSYVAVRHQNFKLLAIGKMSQSVGQIGVQTLAGVLHLGVLGLIAGDAVGRSARGISMMRQEFQRHKSLDTKVSWENLRLTAKRYRRFPQFSMGSALLNSLGSHFPTFLLAFLYDTQVVGWYSLGQRIISLPMMLIGNAVAQVFVGEAA
ncbi:MAG TPA: lipopolysaccharide biosynthesis protein, partial [Abditibacteriaceae bacterium]